MSESAQVPATTPQDYASLLIERSSDGELPVVVGGQAVNLWALYFADQETELENFAPFTSGDCDVFANQDWVGTVAKRAGLQYRLFPAGVASPEVGIITVPLEQGDTMIQSLRAVLGVPADEVSKRAVLMEFNGATYKVMHPISLLQA